MQVTVDLSDEAVRALVAYFDPFEDLADSEGVKARGRTR